jgi:hypothetical protein
MNTLINRDILSYIDAKNVSPLFLEMGNNRFRRFCTDACNTCLLTPSLKDFFSQSLFQKLIRHFQNINAFRDAYTMTDEPAFMRRFGIVIITFPEAVFPLGYNEVRISNMTPDPIDVDPSLKGVIAEVVEENYEDNLLIQKFAEYFMSSIQYRKPSGIWHTLEGIFDQIIPIFRNGEKHPFKEYQKVTLENWGDFLDKIQLHQNQKIWLPSTASWFEYGSDAVRERADILLHDLVDQRVSLRNIHWRQLEELVAELLTRIGLKVILTKKSHDGGRDIIATGELIPGEPTKLAVEVKHKDVVGVADLRAALYANRDFPALLFATSGRFTVGVFREQRDNQMRLFLKDGVALQQWIDTYALPNQALSADAKKTRG